MAYKVKGIFKGLKVFSRIFTVKEHEMEIGYPTDVKHVAHIGWDSAGSASPSWMNDIMASSDLASLGNFAALTGTSTSRVSQDLDRQQRSGGAVVVAENTSGRRDDSATCPGVPRPSTTKKLRDDSPMAPSASESSSSSTEEVAASPPSPEGHVDAAANAAR